jgi:hypothetical protein
VQDSLPDTPTTRAARAFLAALRDGSPEAIRRLVNEQFTEGMRAIAPMEQHVQLLSELSAQLKAAQRVTLNPTGDAELEIRLTGGDGDVVVRLRVQQAPPHRIENVGIDG